MGDTSDSSRASSLSAEKVAAKREYVEYVKQNSGMGDLLDGKGDTQLIVHMLFSSLC